MLKISVMRKTIENKSKNLKRDDFGIIGNMAWEIAILFHKVSQNNKQNRWMEVNNSTTKEWIEKNATPP